MLSQYCNTYYKYLNHILEISAKSVLDTPVPYEIQFLKRDCRTKGQRKYLTYLTLLGVTPPINFETKDKKCLIYQKTLGNAKSIVSNIDALQ